MYDPQVHKESVASVSLQFMGRLCCMQTLNAPTAAALPRGPNADVCQLLAASLSQANVSRSKAIKALKAAEGDIVSAIMELTM